MCNKENERYTSCVSFLIKIINLIKSQNSIIQVPIKIVNMVT